MDFLERMGEQIGERYIMSKANNAPQQLENFVKKQLKGGAEEPEGEAGTKTAGATEKDGHAASGAGLSEKDEEMARLRRQLAQFKLEKAATVGAAKKSSNASKTTKKTRELETLGTGAGIKKGLSGKKQLEAPRDMKGLKALGAGAAASANSKGKKSPEGNNRRASAARARTELPALSGETRSEEGGKAALAGAGADSYVLEESKLIKTPASRASSAISPRHSVSSLQQELESISSHSTAKRYQSKSVKHSSEHGSEAYGVRPSKILGKQSNWHGSEAHSIPPSSKPAKASVHESEVHGITQSKNSEKQHSDHESEAHSPAPPRVPRQQSRRRGINGYAEVEASPALVPFNSRRERASSETRGDEIYVVEVEEDVPRRRKSMKEMDGGVVKISNSNGRTLYMVR